MGIQPKWARRAKALSSRRRSTTSSIPQTFAALKTRIAETLTALETIQREEVDSFTGRDMCFEFRERRLEFTAENFLLSFSLPNFYFHAATAYDILRWQGARIGKRDYMGRLRLKA